MENVIVTLRAAPVDCWSCRREFTIISSIAVAADDETRICSVSDFTAKPGLLSAVIAETPTPENLGPVKIRSSWTMGSDYLANICPHCDKLFGQTYEVHARYEEYDLAPSERPAAEGWRDVLRSLPE
ncbi:hypothetical protein [Sphingopyxis fribergensis]